MIVIQVRGSAERGLVYTDLGLHALRYHEALPAWGTIGSSIPAVEETA